MAYLMIALVAGLIVGLMLYKTAVDQQAEAQPEPPPGQLGLLDSLRAAMSQTGLMILMVFHRLLEPHVRLRILLDVLLALLLNTLGAAAYSVLTQEKNFMSSYLTAMPALLLLCCAAVILCNTLSASRRVLWGLILISFTGICLQIGAGTSVDNILTANAAAFVFALLFAFFYKWLEGLSIRTLTIVILLMTIALYAVTMAVGTTAEGTSTKVWLRLGGISIQISDLTKLLAFTGINLFLGKKNGLSSWKKMALVAAIVGVNALCLVILHENGTVLVIGLVAFATVILEIKEEKIILLGSLAAGGLAGTAWLLGKFKLIPALADAYTKVQARIAGFAETTGNSQIGTALQELRLTQWLGTAGVNSKVPVAGSDFIFIAVAMKIGMAALIVIVMIYIATLVFALKGKHPVWGIAIVVQSIVALASATAFLPVIGIQPCFLGAGSTAYAVAWACAAMMLVDNCRIFFPTQTRRNKKERSFVYE